MIGPVMGKVYSTVEANLPYLGEIHSLLFYACNVYSGYTFSVAECWKPKAGGNGQLKQSFLFLNYS